jgi:hypothetical protein
MDNHLRRLERQAATGDHLARQQWKAAVIRAGFPDPDDDGPLTEWEEIQKDYDEIFWHAKGPKHFSWSSGCWCCFDVSKWAVKLMQDHHDWGHRGWNNRNAKRKTIRTHRDGSSKNYRPKRKKRKKRDLAPHEQRRKKRYAGRERLYGRETRYEWDPEQERFRRSTVFWVRVPSDE